MDSTKVDDSECSSNIKSDLIWEQISSEVEKICEKIFESTNKILKAHITFGFDGIYANIHPRIEDILFSLSIIQTMLERVSGKLDDTEERIVLNSKQMIWCVEGVALALRNECQADYDRAIAMMRNQAQF